MNDIKKNEQVRLQVFLSRNGYCSRRKAMAVIQEGGVRVNGKQVVEPSFQVSSKDRVEVSGQAVVPKRLEYILLHKPAGYVTTKKDPFAPQTVLDLLPRTLRHLNPVGRLDKETEGLLLLTNDGQLGLRLQHPRYEVLKTYRVRIDGALTLSQKKALEQGVWVEGRKTAPARVSGLVARKAGSEFLLTIHEGRKRQVRQMVKKIRHQVLFLCRMSQGPLSLGTLPRGKYRRLTPEEILALQRGAK